MEVPGQSRQLEPGLVLRSISFTDIGVGATTYYYAIEATDTGRDVSPLSPTAQVTTP
jgi:hypothetical protein